MGRQLRLLAVLLACGLAAHAEEPIAVVATTADLASLVQAVGGDAIVATSLVPARMNAEDYQPRPQDLLRLKGARVLVRVGLDYDLWLDRLLVQVARPEISRGGEGYVDASFAVSVLEVRGMSIGGGDGHAHGSGNPHYWLDPSNAETITSTILEALERVDATHAGRYAANRAAFVARLRARVPDWQAKLAALKGVGIVAYHNSWPYFARRFRLDFVDFIEIKPGVPPTPAHLAGLIASMRARNVRIVVREPQEPERDPAFVANKVGASVVTLAGSVGDLPQASSYLALFDTDVDALAAAVGR
jgi:ABC-type Zn uptake system ZnuABC Zn-binding protein ZnuA